MLMFLRYYWLTAKGYRLSPWKSPYIRWRLETFLGPEAAEMNARKFFHIAWKYRNELEKFLEWVADRQRFQRRSR